MLVPSQPIDARRADRFRPPHCPREDCPDHTIHGRWERFKRKGWYRRQCDKRWIRRFLCRACGRGFSQRTFSTTYRLKRPELLRPVAGMLVAGSAHRQIARHLGCAHATVTRMSVRLGRHAELFARLANEALAEIAEPVVLDHFETFVRSQRERLGIATPSGKESWYVYGVDGARYLGTHRRGARRRPLKRRPRLPAPGEVARSTRKILRSLVTKAPNGLLLISDDHPAYPAQVRRINAEIETNRRIRHAVFANPDRSPGHDRRAARIRDGAMFAVDLLHKLLRHSQKHHGRETIAFGRRVSSTVGRVRLFAAWRNFIKRRTERRPCAETPAMRIGLTDRIWTWDDVLAVRLFERRIAPV